MIIILIFCCLILHSCSGHILTSPQASSLPTLPFTVLVTLFDSTPLTTDDGVLLRRMTLEIGAVHLILACLAVLSHHGPRISNGAASSSAQEVRKSNFFFQLIGICFICPISVRYLCFSYEATHCNLVA